MLAIRTNDILTMSDLPDRNFFEESLLIPKCIELQEQLSNEFINILNSIHTLQKQNISAGREKISKLLSESGYDITVSQVRSKLDFLENQGYIVKRRGRKGTQLTELGYNALLQQSVV